MIEEPIQREWPRYCAALALLGVGFIVGGTVLASVLSSNGLSWSAMASAQASEPLLWIIDSAPLVLGLAGWRLGISHERASNLAHQLEQLLRGREEELAVARADIERLLQWMVDAVVIVDMEGRVVRANPSAALLFARSEQELLGRSFAELLVDGDELIRRLGRSYATALPATVAASGAPVSLTGSPLFDDCGATGVAYVLRDMSALRAAEGQLQATLAQLPSFVVLASPDGVITQTNEVEDEDHAEAVGAKVWDFVPIEQRAVVRSACRRAIETESGIDFLTVIYDADGNERFFESRVGPVLFDDQVFGLVMIKRDVTARHHSEQIQRRLASAVEQASDSVMITDPLGSIVYVNPAFEQVSGYAAAEVIGKNPRILNSGRQSQEVYAELWNTIRGGGAWTGRLENRAKNGDIFTEDVRITPLVDDDGRLEYYLAVKHDVSDQLRQEAERAQGQKLEAIGQLAAGIAHEINTPIQYVSDNVAFLGKAFARLFDAIDAGQSMLDAAKNGNLDPATTKSVARAYRKAKLSYLRPEIPRAIEQSAEGVSRVGKIVRAMKEFSHPSQGELEPIDLARSIETTITVARNEWKYVADVVTEFDEDMPPVPCLRDEINQVVLNMIVNAAHAIAEKTEAGGGAKGTIRVATRASQDAAVIEIGDTGAGMPSEVLRRVFDPFFTTKPVGRGTGQGLAIAHNVVVDKHQGAIEVDSKVGEGTTFTISLPLGRTAGVGEEARGHASTVR